MSKFIAFIADGTWNGPGQSDANSTTGPITNVLKAYRTLDGIPATVGAELAPEQEQSLAGSGGQVVQVAKYLDGVGYSENPLVRAMGGGFGAGTIARIVRGYTFVSRNFDADDAIVLVGFSRGAYTARALGGLIATLGLLDRTKLNLSDTLRAYALGCAAWRRYRAATCSDEGFLQKIAEAMPTLESFLVPDPSPDQYITAPIRAIAVWDTVGSLGIPDFGAQGTDVDLFRSPIPA